ncbi:hypothetical protein ILUMI_26039 [Ignelater luminosus]|uniref:Reverse transcriptase domain-containing protein n=1 Tax=Ignelater luminosus TaxID=2038154 RepID=A0A8K0C8R2_IGNLU|nr:hypothetical protein ILUMI_26039 [Ignelater luminosus]
MEEFVPLRNKIIKFLRGPFQEFPSSSFVFSLTIQSIIEVIKSELNCWFLDDGTLGGDPKNVLKDFYKIKELFFKMRFEINPAKCELLFVGTKKQKVFDEFSVASPGIQIIEKLTILGSPVIKEAISTTLSKKLECSCSVLLITTLYFDSETDVHFMNLSNIQIPGTTSAL